MFDLKTLVRPNIQILEPYHCAREEYNKGILLDANENPYGPSLNTTQKESECSLNRYPDPLQTFVKRRLCDFRNYQRPVYAPITPNNIFMGVGSDEAIDLLIRCFCVPGHDKLLICPPTYGMYSVSAQINDVDIVKVPLNFHDFSLNVEAIIETLRTVSSIKIIYLCSPGNPTGKIIDELAIRRLMDNPWNGIIVVDEAYIDFSEQSRSLSTLVNFYPNLVVMQTLSKSFGLAGVRVGFAFCSFEVALLLNKIKAPYNISTPTAELAARALSKEGILLMKKNTRDIVEQRECLTKELVEIQGVGKIIGGLDANFLLFTIINKTTGEPDSDRAFKVYKRLAETKNVVVRFRGNEPGCEGAIRVTVGTKDECDIFLLNLRESLMEC